MNSETGIVSVVMAAGRGSRMTGYTGNKTLLPLKPNSSPYHGTCPILLQILKNLPAGPKAIVVNYDKQAVMEKTSGLNPHYCLQPELNGTGGALLASRRFLEQVHCDRLIITMGDVPLVKPRTYLDLIEKLNDFNMVVLGFRPEDKNRYGLLAVENGSVKKIIEHTYWKDLTAAEQSALPVCNSGIYAVRRADIVAYLTVLEQRPHIVRKEVGNRVCEIREFFITDLVEYMASDGLSMGYVVSEDEQEVMGVDDLIALKRAQVLFQQQYEGNR